MSGSDSHRYGGSSPPARGSTSGCPTNPVVLRIIPACAGSTGSRTAPTPPSADHPRLRGEHAGAARWAYNHAGSSPTARGAHLVDLRRRRREPLLCGPLQFAYQALRSPCVRPPRTVSGGAHVEAARESCHFPRPRWRIRMRTVRSSRQSHGFLAVRTRWPGVDE